MKSRKNKKMFGVAGILLIIAVILCTSSVFALLNTTKEDKQLYIPETKDFIFDEVGTYTIFHEYAGVAKDLTDVQIMVQEQTTGQVVDMKSYTGATYEINGRKGRSLYQFEIDKPGIYQIATENDGLDTKGSILTIKQDFVKNLLFIVLGIIAGSILGIGGIVLFILTYVLRKRQNLTINN